MRMLWSLGGTQIQMNKIPTCPQCKKNPVCFSRSRWMSKCKKCLEYQRVASANYRIKNKE